ncbi:MAG TPA: response regulator transcription factor [Pyrinomonadaceae bacterium]|jgi:DNA-binding NarL/FixJ family response regulator
MLSVVLAEDHSTVREGIKMLVNAQSDMRVIGEAGNGSAAIKTVREKRPDVVVMDISMPEMNGLKATRRLKAEFPDIKILTLTRHSDDSFLEQLIAAGASGYVLKQSAPAELVNAIRTVGGGNAYLDPTLRDKVIGGFLHRGLRGDRRLEMTGREAEVLRLIAWGFSNKEIAARLDLSVKTVEAHKANAMRKMNLRGRIDIVRYAILQGWLEDN